MASTKQGFFRKIAENELDRRLGNLEPALKQELSISLIRQWITNDGHAGLVTPSRHFWFHMVRKEDGGADVGFEAHPGRFAKTLLQWGVAEDQVPGLMHQLNLCQSVRHGTGDGRTLQLRMDAAKKMLSVQEAEEDD